MLRIAPTISRVLGHTAVNNQILLIAIVLVSVAILVAVFLLFLFYRKNSLALLRRLQAIEKETQKIEDTQTNNTVCLSDIHGIVSSIDEKQPFHEPHNYN